MNKIDKGWYEALRFLSRLTTKEAKKLKDKDLSDFRKYVSEDIENTRHLLKTYQNFRQNKLS